MSRIKTPRELARRARVLQKLLDTGDSFATLLCKPAQLAEAAAAQKPKMTFIDSLRTGQEPDSPL